MELKLDVRGIEKAIKELEKLDKKIQRKELRRAVTAGSRPIRTAAKARVPTRFGYLRKSIDTKVKTYKSGAVAAIIGPRSDVSYTVTDEFGKSRKVRPANYAHLVEFGTAPHTTTYRGREVQHPGSKAYGFVRSALQSAGSQALSIIEAKLREALKNL